VLGRIRRDAIASRLRELLSTAMTDHAIRGARLHWKACRPSFLGIAQAIAPKLSGYSHKV
jgi:hypothetical protein